MLFFGWGRRKVFDLGNGYVLICMYEYFHISFILRIVTSKKWFIQEVSTQHAKALTATQVRQLLGRRTPFIHDYGALFGNGVKELDWHGANRKTALNSQAIDEEHEESEQFDDEPEVETEPTARRDSSSELPIISLAKFIGKKFDEGWETSESEEKPSKQLHQSTGSRTRKSSKNYSASKYKLRYYILLAVAVFIVGVVIASKAKSPNDSSDFVAGLLIIISAAILLVCIIIWVIRLIKSKSKHKEVHNYNKVLANKSARSYKANSKVRWTTLVIVGIIVLVAVLHRPVDNYITIHTANQTMVKLAQNAGMSTEGEVLFLRTKPQLVTDSQMESDCSSNTAASNSDGFIEQGCYDPTTNRIYIRKVPSDLYNLEVSTAAYEMLHPVYLSIYNSGQGTALDQAIESNYKAINDSFLNTQVANFAKTEPGDRDLELFSLLGTGYSNLSNNLANYYVPYFNNIAETVYANNAVTQLFQNDVTQLNQLNTTINSDDNNTNNEYATANVAYNDSVSWANEGNQYEDTYNYNIYTQDYNTYSQDINQENSDINQYNQVLQSYNTLVTQYNGTQPVSQIQTVRAQSQSSQ